jgi:hypothetical protein
MAILAAEQSYERKRDGNIILKWILEKEAI